MHFALLSLLIMTFSSVVFAKTIRAPGGHEVPEECVNQVPDGAKILSDGKRVKYPDGTIHQISNCGSTPAPSVGTWTYPEYSRENNGGGYSYLTGDWTVPVTPAVYTGQTIYFYNGLEPSNGYCILQPVLGFNGNNVSGPAWTIASWYYCGNPNGTYTEAYSPTISVSPGDSITGTMSLDSSGTTWTVITKDNTTGKSVTLSASASAVGGLQTWAYGGVLEVWNITSCDMYPYFNPLNFTNTNAVAAGVPETPNFTPYFNNSDGCGENVIMGPNAETSLFLTMGSVGPSPSPSPSPSPQVSRPTVNLVASPSSISTGQSSTLSYSSSNATSCSGSGFSVSGTSGSAVVSPSASTTYSISCTGPGGTASANATVKVTTSSPTGKKKH